MEIDLVKGGQSVMLVTLGRPVGKLAKQGVSLTVSVKAHPAVEEFMAGLLPEEPPTPANLYGRSWVPLDTRPLSFYALPLELTAGITAYSLDRPCQQLLAPSNLSFLRLVGITEGVSFGIKGVPLRHDRLTEMREAIGIAARAFWRDFIKPVDVTVALVTQEFEKPLLVAQDYHGG
jgi:hypothetical protein